MAQQAIEPLTDEEILSVADDPAMVAKFNSEERRRLSRLKPASDPNRPRIQATPDVNQRVDSNMLGIDHEQIMHGIANWASKLSPGWQRPAAMLATFPVDALASLAEMFSAPESVAAAGAPAATSAMGKVADAATGTRAALSAPAETFISRKLGLDPAAIELQATRMRLQAAKSRTRQGQMARRLDTESAGATPPEAAAPNAPNADMPPSPSPSRAPVARATQSAGASAPFDLNSLTPVEQTQGAQWLAEGVPADVVLQRIQSSRQMTGVLKTATPDEAAREVARMTREAAKRSTRKRPE